jgi:heme exporter protein CcmD
VTDDLLGKYALFVVPAYLMTIVGFAALAIHTRRRLKFWKRRVKEEERRKAAP